MLSYDLITQECNRLNLPVSYKADVTKNDHYELAQLPENAKFIWQLREAGSNLCASVNPAQFYDFHYINMNMRVAYAYIFNGKRLQEVSTADCLTWAVENLPFAPLLDFALKFCKWDRIGNKWYSKRGRVLTSSELAIMLSNCCTPDENGTAVEFDSINWNRIREKHNQITAQIESAMMA